jgi:hypothetical protein
MQNQGKSSLGRVPSGVSSVQQTQHNTSSFSLCHNATLSTKVRCDQVIAYQSTRAIRSSDTRKNQSHLQPSKPATAKDSLNR